MMMDRVIVYIKMLEKQRFRNNGRSHKSVRVYTFTQSVNLKIK